MSNGSIEPEMLIFAIESDQTFFLKSEIRFLMTIQRSLVVLAIFKSLSICCRTPGIINNNQL